MKNKIISPIHFLVIKKNGNAWYFNYGRVFYNRNGVPIAEDQETMFGITKAKLVIELFRINCGSDGYYLANLRDKKYYYCGLEFEDINTKLRDLGIGRTDPVDYPNLPD